MRLAHYVLGAGVALFLAASALVQFEVGEQCVVDADCITGCCGSQMDEPACLDAIAQAPGEECHTVDGCDCEIGQCTYGFCPEGTPTPATTGEACFSDYGCGSGCCASRLEPNECVPKATQNPQEACYTEDGCDCFYGTCATGFCPDCEDDNHCPDDTECCGDGACYEDLSECGLTPSPTKSPTPAMTSPPTKSTTPAPITPPVKSPASAPTPSPTKSPTPAPKTPSPTTSPTLAATTRPTKSPTPAITTRPNRPPTPAPTSSLTKSPTPAPIPPLAKSPTPAPTSSPTKSPNPALTPSPITSPAPTPTPALTPDPTQSPSSTPKQSPPQSPSLWSIVAASVTGLFLWGVLVLTCVGLKMHCAAKEKSIRRSLECLCKKGSFWGAMVVLAGAFVSLNMFDISSIWGIVRVCAGFVLWFEVMAWFVAFKTGAPATVSSDMPP